MASVVRSSGVGPRPPVVINTRELRRLPHERDQTLAVIPQHRLAVMGQAEAANRSPIQRAFPFRMLPRSSSTDTEQLNAAALGRFKHGFGEWANDATSALP